MKPLSFFIKNIGKRIYRDNDGCDCSTCKDVVENGIIVADKDHAEYIYAIQCEYYQEGIKLNYRTKK